MAKESAQSWLKAMLDPRLSQNSCQFRQGSFSGIPVGDECWGNPQFHILYFTAGPVFVAVYVLGEGVDNSFVEALAAGIEYRIRQHPKLQEKSSQVGLAGRSLRVLVSNRSMAQGQAIALGGGGCCTSCCLPTCQSAIPNPSHCKGMDDKSISGPSVGEGESLWLGAGNPRRKDQTGTACVPLQRQVGCATTAGSGSPGDEGAQARPNDRLAAPVEASSRSFKLCYQGRRMSLSCALIEDLPRSSPPRTGWPP